MIDSMNVFMVVVWLASAGMSLVIAVALITWVVRTWQLMKGESSGSSSDQILDGIDQLRLQVDAMSERLRDLAVRSLPPGPDERSRETPQPPDSE